VTGPDVQFHPPNVVDRLVWAQFFSREALIEIDAGSGDGSFVLARAAQFPDRNFLAIERLLGRVRKTCRLAAEAGLKNVRVLRLETLYTFTHLLPNNSVSVIHVGFPDPWPKRKHQRKRLLRKPFFEIAQGLLVAGGELRIKTDDEPYYLEIAKTAAEFPGFVTEEWIEPLDYPKTGFERSFLAEGKTISRLLLRKRE